MGQNTSVETTSFDTNCYHVSCSSDNFDPNDKDMAGFVLYSYNNERDFWLNGHHIQAGYILIKKTSNISHISSKYGQVHGSLYKWFFDEEPEDSCGKINGFGFAYYRDAWQFKSYTLNDRVPEAQIPMDIAVQITSAIESYWKTGKQNYPC